MSMYKNARLWTRFSSLLRRKLGSVPSLHACFNSQLQCLNAPHTSLAPIEFFLPRIPGTFPRERFPINWRCFDQGFCSQSFAGKCWNCDSLLQSKTSLVCESCRCIQPVDHSVDYFQIFGLEKKFDIEVDSLDGKYKDWQKKLHPDLVHSKSETERAYSAEQSARVIDAYRTLSSPLSRAMYLMKLQGIHVDEEQTVSDPELLGEIMEIRESVEEASDSQALKQIQSQVQEKLRLWSDSFLSAFRSQSIEEAMDSIRRMTYYKRVNEEIVKRL